MKGTSPLGVCSIFQLCGPGRVASPRDAIFVSGVYDVCVCVFLCLCAYVCCILYVCDMCIYVCMVFVCDVYVWPVCGTYA